MTVEPRPEGRVFLGEHLPRLARLLRHRDRGPCGDRLAWPEQAEAIKVGIPSLVKTAMD
jgi:hypothetical protein